MKKFGLNAYPDKVKGSGLKWKIRELYWQLRYAWQRAWRGYDYTDVFELGFNFVDKMPALLKEFKENNVGLFYDTDTNTTLTKEETDSIIDEMIYCFENCDEDHVYERLYGVKPWEDEFDLDKSFTCMDERNACWTKAMSLFSKWLWY